MSRISYLAYYASNHLLIYNTEVMKKLLTTYYLLLTTLLLTGCSMFNTNSPDPNLSQAEAQALIEQTEDKSTIDKATWLASGLTESQYKILWKAGTERPFTSPLNDEKRAGTFVTAGCGIPVFSSEHKFESGTGWPSFWEVVDKDNVILKEDNKFGWKRVEVLSKCGEHLGHVFPDGPQDKTGLRYCINGEALRFVPEE